MDSLPSFIGDDTERHPMTTESRFSQVSRRGFLGGMSLAALTGLVACASDNTSTTSAATTAAAPTSSATETATETATAATTTASATETAAASGTLSGSGEVSFTFSGNGFKNPYYAVWVQDEAGELVKTLLLCHLAGGQDRWLNELTKWYQVSGGSDTTTEGTKPAGTYTAAWDGTDSTGSKVAAGTYTFCVESAVEHGNYSYLEKAVALGSGSTRADLGSDGDLGVASLTWTA